MESSVGLLETRPFSEAKTHLSEVMSEVVREHRPSLVARFEGKESMLLVDVRDMKPLLEPFAFSTKASVSDGEFILRQPEFGLVAGGSTFDAAAEELVELASAYAAQFLDRWAFYKETDRARQLPWVFRIAIASPTERRAILLATPGPTAAQP
jgi:hypothetical protein